MSGFWDGKRVLVTGHTGFKGSWLTLWLEKLNASVFGLALPPDTSPSLFEELGLGSRVDHLVGDIRDETLVSDRVAAVKPDIVFHLAAQPLVRRSYSEPMLTWQTNVAGTINLLEALRQVDHLCAVVAVTTDKVYENREWPYPYRELDRLGGHDPYSSSKAAGELAVASWRSSFFEGESGVRIASARAGNVIGGGDWAADRLIPDLIRALESEAPITLRNPLSIRPWQHVLEPLSGYLALAQLLHETDSPSFQSAFNFGPGNEGHRSVAQLVDECLKHSKGEWHLASGAVGPHEAGELTLTTEKSRQILGWQPRWSFAETVQHTMSWYQAARDGRRADALCAEQIGTYDLAVQG